MKPFSIWVLVFMLACGGLSRLFAGELEVYFGPTKAKDAAGLHTQTIKVIDSAKKTLDGAIHELRLQSIVDALVAAKQRGVEVRVICDDAYYENEFMKQLRAAKIPTKHDGNTKAIMHDKFVVADGERMVTGSYNLTDTCSFNNHNNLLVISNRDVSQIYAAEFEKLWAGHFYDSEDGAIQHAVMQVDGRKVPVDILFQPRYKDTKDKVVELLSSAQKSLYMAQFAFFSAKVANLMSAKLEAGVDVRAVIDYSMVYGELEPLNQIGELAEKRIPFCIGDDPNGKMHHKFFVVDPDSSSAMVLTGSANASSSGYDSNVENIIVVHDQKVAKQYKDEVLHLLNRRATGTVTIPRKGINGVGKVQTFDINIESGGEALKQLEITLPYFWRVQSAETVTATRGDAATPVSLRLEERSPSRESKVKVQILMADAANLTADGPDSKLSLHLGAVNLDPKTHTGRYCIYVRGSDASGKLQVIPNLPILWLFRSAAESIAEADRLLSAKDDRSAKDLEYLLRDLSSNLYQEIDTGKLSAMKDFVALVEKTAQDKNPRFKMVSNTARLVCQRLVAAYGVDANSGEEGAALAARLKTTLTSGGVELKPPKEVHVEAPPATAEGFKADLVEALHRYHNTDGKGNGGSVSGLQLPPGVKDLPALEKEIDKLASWLIKRPEIAYRPSPDGERALREYRRAIAFERRKAVSADANAVVTRGMACVADPELRKALEAALKAAPPEFYAAPSSSSGKHHPADEINPGGLALHSVRDLIFGQILCDYYGVKGHDRDVILAALLLHDIKKGGEPWNNYDPAHGPIGAKWLGTVWSATQSPALDAVRSLVHNHMAQWNAPQPTPPADLANQIVSYADYLASLDGFYVTVP